MSRPPWHTPVDTATRDWIERAAGRGWRVARTGRMQGGIAAAVDGVNLVGPDGSTRRLVLKRWLRPDWQLTDARYTAGREAAVLRRLAGTEVPVPGVIAADEDGGEIGAPAILMTHVDGHHPTEAEDQRPDRIAAMAAALVAIHAIDDDIRAVVGDFEFYSPLDRVVIPAAAPRPGLWRAAIERVAGGQAAGRGVFLHRDYHPWNTLWRRGRLTGVVDWTNASWGEPAMDLAHWRSNLGTSYGLEAADRVVGSYAAAGGVARDQTWWDIRILLDFIGDEDWSPPHSLATAEAYLQALLARP
jgi:aminoglycoside phosphotransferase (APT) family kinase protein